MNNWNRLAAAVRFPPLPYPKSTSTPFSQANLCVQETPRREHSIPIPARRKPRPSSFPIPEASVPLHPSPFYPELSHSPIRSLGPPNGRGNSSGRIATFILRVKGGDGRLSTLTDVHFQAAIAGMGPSPRRTALLGLAEDKIRHGCAKRGRRRAVVCRSSDACLEWVWGDFASGYRGARHHQLGGPRSTLVERQRACKIRARDRVRTPPTDPAGDTIQEDASTDKYAQVPSLLESHSYSAAEGHHAEHSSWEHFTTSTFSAAVMRTSGPMPYPGFIDCSAPFIPRGHYRLLHTTHT